MSETDKTGSGQPENNQPRADQPGAENAPANDPEPAAESVADDAIPDEASSAEPPGERDYEAEIAELNDRLLRTLAEGENLRRRAQREREETSKYAIAGFARDVLGVADNLRRALDALPEAAQDNDGETALHKAAWNGDRLMVKFLVEVGADTNVCDHEGWCPAHFAVMRGHTEIVAFFMDIKEFIVCRRPTKIPPLGWKASADMWSGV